MRRHDRSEAREWLLGLDSEPLAPSESEGDALPEDSPGRQDSRSEDWLTTLDDFRNYLIMRGSLSEFNLGRFGPRRPLPGTVWPRSRG